VRITRLIVIACVLFALIVPLQAFAQSAYYGDVKGTVYSQAFRAPGVKVTLYTMDPVSHMPAEEKATATTDSNGEFNFQYVVFQPAGQFQYQVRAQRGSDAAYAWVFALPAEAASDIPVYVAPINMDLSVPSGTSEATVTVWSTQGQVTSHSNLAPVPGVKLTLYSYDPATGNRTVVIDNKISDSNGQGIYSNIPYGTYVVRAEKSGQYGEQSFAAYQQITSTSLSANLPIPSPTPTPAPTATPGPSSTTTPGFEAFVALIALLGGALYLRRV
jgi:PGF-CTERM protein